MIALPAPAAGKAFIKESSVHDKIHTEKWTLALGTLALLLGGCGGGGGGDTGPDAGSGFNSYAQAQEIITEFADQVAVPTYASLATALANLDTAVQTLAGDPSDANLQAARDAWVAAREPWESSEGFRFGPVVTLALGEALDSGPTDRTAIDAVIDGGDALTEEHVASLAPTLRGFHTAEYLLYGADGTKTAADLSDREVEYLTAVSSLLAQAGSDLETSWTMGLEDAPHAELLKSAGFAGNDEYPTLASAAEEIVRGMIRISGEVADDKIAGPFDQQDASLVESPFAASSLTDFTNNVRSIQNAYTGDAPLAGTTGAGLDQYIASEDPALDTRLKAEIQAAIDALGQIPAPFRDAITDPEAADEIRAAQEAIRTAQTTLEQDILPFFL